MGEDVRSNPKLKPREIVILSEKYEQLVAWYQEILGFRVVKVFCEGYRYTNLETESGIRIGIAPAAEVGVKLRDRAANSVILQIGVPDVRALFEHLCASGGKAVFGPSFDERGRFWYGGFTDLEGNPIWVVDENCP